MRIQTLPGGAFLVLSALGVVSNSYAQEAPPYDSAVDVQLFEYAVGPKSFLTVSDAKLSLKDQFNVDALITFMTDPFTVYNVTADGEDIINTRVNVVESLLAGEISGAYGLMDKLQVGASIPMILSMSGEGLEPATARPGDSLQVSGLGDMRLEAKYQAYEREGLLVAALGGFTVPTSVGSGGGDFLGDNLPTARLRAAVQWSNPQDNLTVGANVGAIFRKPREIYSSTVGQQLTYGVGAAAKANERVSIIAEMFGRTGMAEFDLSKSPLEVNGGVRVKATKSIAVLAGGGAGLVKGIGSPGLRMFVSIGWAPDYADSDGDGVPNLRDKCPLVAEDKDGFEDDDGCPDPDNDGDKRLDDDDKCPNQREDFDGFEDDDGCPEVDNDKDGIDDLKDRCPNDPEDKKGPNPDDGCPANKRDSDADGIMDSRDRCPKEEEDEDGFEDWDGCPDLDNDKDGIPDDQDKCPLCAEDKDGFDDENGCPELDNDFDGIPDDKDKCADGAEVINGIDDFDGCPDKGGIELVRINDDRVEIDRPITFTRGDDLTKGGAVITDQLAAVMISHPEVTKWLVVVAEKKGRNEAKARRASERRAESVKARLLKRGVSEGALQVVGAVSDDSKVGVVIREKAETDETGFFCPEQYKAVPREETAMPEEPAPAEEPEPMPAEKDSDADGMTDATDACPDEAGPVENNGCPDTDRDGDSVVDRLDNCPDEKGTVDNHGCKKKQLVEIKGEKIEILQKVMFATAKSRIRHASYKLLDNVASVLKSHPEIKKIQVVGHTDSVGKPESNLKLSQARAESVVKYLVKKGVAADRLEPIGKGDTEPIGDNATKEGQEQNRRVEFKIVAE